MLKEGKIIDIDGKNNKLETIYEPRFAELKNLKHLSPRMIIEHN
jgi:hypothetical protein